MGKSIDFGLLISDCGINGTDETNGIDGINEREWLELAMSICYMDMLILVNHMLLALRGVGPSGPEALRTSDNNSSALIARKLIRTMARKLVERFPDQISAEVLDEWRKEGLV